MPKETIHTLCSSGDCCPVLCEREDRSVAIQEDGLTLVELSPETADGLARVLFALGYGKEPQS